MYCPYIHALYKKKVNLQHSVIAGENHTNFIFKNQPYKCRMKKVSLD